MCGAHTETHTGAIKKSEIVPNAATWMDLESFIYKWSKPDKDK